MPSPYARSRATALAVVTLTTLTATLLAPATAASAAGDRTPPTAPGNLRVTGVAETSVSLAWSPSTDNAGPVRYVVELVDRPFSFGPYTGPSGTINDSTLLPPATTHTFRVRAYDGAFNYSAPSNTVTATTLPDVQAPTTPPGVRLVSATPHTALLEWQPSTDNVGWPSDVRYRVSLGSTVLGWSESLNGRPVRFEQWHLPAGVALTFTVHAVDRSGNLSAPARLAVDLPDSTDTTPPSPPALLSAVDAGYGQAKLTWAAATDNSTPAGELAYQFVVDGERIFFNGRESVYPVVRDGGTVGWASAPAAPGTFRFAVVAVDRAGNVSAPSNEIPVAVTTEY